MRRLFTALLVILSLVLLAGCTLPDIDIPTIVPPSPTPTPKDVTPIIPTWTPPPMGNSAPALPDIASVVAKIKPSVVTINTEVVSFDIFNRPFTQKGAGSGWIIGESGIIVTNNHVVEDARTVTVTLADGRTFTATPNKIRADALSDLAVVQIDAQGLPAAKVGDSSALRVGDWVVAIGNSLGLGISATTGIVSALGVSVSPAPGQTLGDLVQTDAAINPGNSGGPLVNMAGEVVGINSIKIRQVGVEGMGYAISSKTAIPIIRGLVEKGFVVRPYLGVVLRPVDPFLVLRYDLGVGKGAFITEVASSSPAARAGLQSGDVIVGLNSKEINSADDLIGAIHAQQIGKTVEVTYWRGKNKRMAQATLLESPTP
ncbi:MAG: trypsin-like peptidase domain-containing protein [Chloroflexota bacterium]